MIEFPFKQLRSKKFGKILVPLIPITIIGPKGTMDVDMILDSGADISFIPYSAGEILGLEAVMENRGEVSGIGQGGVSYILSETEIKIKDYKIKAHIGWALIEEVPFLLGRLDIFKKFAIEFREFENKIRFTPVV